MTQPVSNADLALTSSQRTLATAVVAFCRLLRKKGVKLQADASQTAMSVLAEIDITNRLDFRNVLLVALLQRPEDRALFIYLFNAFWMVAPSQSRQPESALGLLGRPLDTKGSLQRSEDEEDDQERPNTGTMKRSSTAMVQAETESASLEASHAATHGQNISSLGDSNDQQMAELERLARHLGPLLATRRSRRRVSDRRGNFPDPHKMLRSSLRYGGIPVELQRTSRRVTRTRLIVLCDVSRSMDEYASLFLQFAAAVRRRPWQVEVFLFATELRRVTQSWMHQSWTELKKMVPDCGGGTRIGACLSEFVHNYGDAMLGARTIVVILSDGLETGEPAQLDAAMEQLRRRSHAVVWLNPLLHLEGYEPRTAGIVAALKYVDLFAPAHDLASLWELQRQLRMLAGRGRGSLMRQLGRLASNDLGGRRLATSKVLNEGAGKHKVPSPYQGIHLG
jgi:uncharacterized protein with von Willebrand factor type A (vWA) domain